jgi:plasmid stabilization system protein ParE
MAKLLIWSDRALAEYDKLQEYLYAELGYEITQSVIKEIAQTVVRIQNSPEHFPYFRKKKKIRRSLPLPRHRSFLMLTEI